MKGEILVALPGQLLKQTKWYEIVDHEQDDHSWVIAYDPRIRRRRKTSVLQKNPERFSVFPLFRV